MTFRSMTINQLCVSPFKAKDTIGPLLRALPGAAAWIHPMLRFEATP